MSDDYPTQLRNAPPDTVPDGRGYWNRECTSFGAWRAAQRGVALDHYGDAGSWPAACRRDGRALTGSGAPGSLALFPAGVGGAGPRGHVAYVLGRVGPLVIVEDYNWNDAHAYAIHTVAAAGPLYLPLAALPGPVPPAPAQESDMVIVNVAGGLGYWSLIAGTLYVPMSPADFAGRPPSVPIWLVDAGTHATILSLTKHP